MYEENNQTTWSWRHAIMKADLEPHCKLILYTLSLYVSEVGKAAFPSLETLESNTGLTKKTLIKYMNKCSDEGWLFIVKTKSANGRQQVNKYHPSYPSVIQDSTECNLGTKPSVIQVKSRVEELHPIYKELNINRNIKETSVSGVDVVTWWNGLAEKYSLSQIKKLTGTRTKHLNARVKDAGSLSKFKKEVELVLKQSTFVLGENDRGWKADLDFFLNDSNYSKAVEGKYKTHEDASTFTINHWGNYLAEFLKNCPEEIKDAAKALHGAEAKGSVSKFYIEHSKGSAKMDLAQWVETYNTWEQK